jgi:hypothetical protein
MKLHRWGLVLSQCQVCRFSGRLMIEPVGGGRRARWQFHVVHKPCRGRVAGIEPIDLLDVDESDPGPWLTHAATPSAARA